MPEVRAAYLLERYGIARPPVPDGLIYLIGAPRLIVRLSADLPEELPGVLVWGKNTDIIWLRQQDSIERRRFSMWHEGGHWLLHEGSFYMMAYGTEEQETEREANAFAAALLMPEPWLHEYGPQVNWKPWAMAPRFGVSVAAMTRRLRELGLP